LGEAVDRPEAPDEIDGVDADDAAAREEVGEEAERLVVARVVERGD